MRGLELAQLLLILWGMTDTRSYSCGHLGPAPLYYGRGQARERRLAVYFSRPCLSCAEVKLLAYCAGRTDLSGAARPIDPADKLMVLRRSYL